MKVIAIGTESDITHNHFTGQSVMFDGIINLFREKMDKVAVLDISSRFKSFSPLTRSIDYAFILIKLFFCTLFIHYDIAYIITAQSKRGFIRDYAMIRLLHFFDLKIVTHQYGANYYQLLDALSDKGLLRLKKMLGYVSTIIVEGDYMKNQFSFLDNYEDKVRVIPNGLPIVGKNAMQSKKIDSNQTFKIFYLSNLIWSKGYFDVLLAVEILINKYKKNVECVFAGAFMPSVDDDFVGISSRASFDRFIKDHHLENVVSYYPGLYGDQKDAVFFSSNVFVLPTYYINEGQPISVIEAMSYGCVPIVTKYRHIPMMVSEDNGCFVEPKNPEQIAGILAWLMDNPEEYKAKSQASINDYQSFFTFDKYASRVLQTINEVNKDL